MVFAILQENISPFVGISQILDYKFDGDFSGVDSDLRGTADSDGLGLLSFDEDEDQMAVRVQFQLLF